MFNYFYTVEVDLTDECMKNEFGPTVGSMFNSIAGMEFTSKIYLTEKECVDDVMAEVDKVSDNLIDKHNIDKLAVETYPNPFLLYDETSKHVTDLSEEERIFWKPNKMALFAMFKNRDEEDFLVRFVIYCIEDESIPKDAATISLLKAESPSKFLN